MNLVSGLDLVEIHRISSLKASIKERFVKRILTENERKKHPGDPSIAGIFAAKEATAKALGCGIGAISWQEIEILPDQLGAPRLELTGKALHISTDLGISNWSVSITHTAEFAAAQVVGIGQGNEPSNHQR
jgi:holo-[acyl-carrier protein] synthase